MVAQRTISIGTCVCDVVAGSDTGSVYVAADDCVTVMTGCDIAARIPVGFETKRLILGADGAFVYVFGYEGSVRVIRTADHTIGTVSGNPSIAEVVSPNGRGFYTAHSSTTSESTDSWISATAADGTAIAAVAINDYPTGMGVSPGGGHLYVATSRISSYSQYFPGFVTVIDAAHYTVVETIAVPLSPDTVTVSPDGSRVFVTHYDTNVVSSVDVERRSATLVSLPDAPLCAVVSPDGTRIYVIGVRSLVAADFVNKTAEIIAGVGMPRRLLFSADGKRAYVADLASSGVVMLDTTTNSVITTVGFDGHPEAMALSGDGELLYVADYWAGTVSAISIASVMRDAEAA